MNKMSKRSFVLISIILGMFLSAIEATIVATAMPSIVEDLGGFTLYSWVFSAYLLSSSATILLFGKLADVFGRKPIYIFGVVVFLTGSTIAGFSQSMFLLVIARFIQGTGAGAIVPVASTIIGDIYSKEERAKIQGYLSSVWGISAVLGPLIGAFFVEWLNWRYVFWMNIPLGLLSLIGILFFLNEQTDKKEKYELDVKGTVLLITSISVFMYIFVEGGISVSWTSITMFFLIVISVVSFIIFLIVERKSKQPIIPPTVWSYKLIRYANITSLLTGAIVLAVSSYLPVFVQIVMEQPVIVAGFTLTTMSIGWPIASSIAGRLLLKIGYRYTSIIGGIFLIIGAITFNLLPTIQQAYWAALGSFFIGAGMGMTSTSFIVAIQTTVKWEIRGIATATNMFMRSIGSALGVAFFGGLLNSEIKRQMNTTNEWSVSDMDQLLNNQSLLSNEALELFKFSLTNGLQMIYFIMMIIATLSFIMIFFIPKDEAS